MQRLFIAIELPADILEQLRKIQAHLRNCTSRGRFVPENNMHLTLQFLGDVTEQQVPDINAALRQVACKNASFSLTLGEPGVFGKSNPYPVAWLGLSGDLPVLCRLQADIKEAMAGLGFIGDHDRYRPHITLARDITFCEHNGPGWSFDQKCKHTFMVQQFASIASSLYGGTRIYRVVQHFQFSSSL